VVLGDTLVDITPGCGKKTNPEVIKYLEDENAYTEAMMKPTKGCRKDSTRKCWPH
jgi:protease II